MQSFDGDIWDLNDTRNFVSMYGGMRYGGRAVALCVVVLSCTVEMISGMVKKNT